MGVLPTAANATITAPLELAGALLLTQEAA